jgi:hypothetical protein
MSRMFSGRRAEGSVRLVGVTAIYVALTAIATYPQVRQFAGGIRDDIDVYFSVWRLAWIAHQLPRHPLQLFDANIFYPERHTLAYSDALVGPGIVTAPLFWLRANPILIYNLLLFGVIVLSGLAMFVLVETVTKSVTAALISGALFVLSPYRLAHYSQLDLQTTALMPVALWALHRTLATRRRRYALLLGVSLALQTYSGIYYGIYFATYLCVVAPLLVLAEPWSVRPRIASLLFVSALIAGLLVLPYLLPYLAARATVGVRDISETLYFSATPRDYFLAPPGNALYDGLLASNWRGNFLGIVVMLFAAVGLWPPTSVATTYLLGAAFAFEASLGLHGYTFPWLRAWVLPYRGLRVPSRFAMLVVVSLVILAGIGVARIAERLGSRGRALLVALALIAAVAEARTPPVLTSPRTSAAGVDRWLRQQPPSAIVELPLPSPDRPFDIVEGRHMYDSIFHWQRLANGYSGFWPRSYLELLEHMRTFPDHSSVDYLQHLGIRFVVVRSALMGSSTDFAHLSGALRGCPELISVGRIPEEVGESLVYEVSMAAR